MIVDVIDFVKPEVYDTGKNSPEFLQKVEAPGSALAERVRAAFSKEIGLNIFIKLGGAGGPTTELAGKCNCAQNSIPSCWDEICQRDSCQVQAWGCGVGWAWECDGKCPARPPGMF